MPKRSLFKQKLEFYCVMILIGILLIVYVNYGIFNNIEKNSEIELESFLIKEGRNDNFPLTYSNGTKLCVSKDNTYERCRNEVIKKGAESICKQLSWEEKDNGELLEERYLIKKNYCSRYSIDKYGKKTCGVSYHIFDWISEHELNISGQSCSGTYEWCLNDIPIRDNIFAKIIHHTFTTGKYNKKDNNLICQQFNEPDMECSDNICFIHISNIEKEKAFNLKEIREMLNYE